MKPITNKLLLITSIFSLCIYLSLPKKEYIILKGTVSTFGEPIPSVVVAYKRNDGKITQQPTNKQGEYTLGINMFKGSCITLLFKKKGFFHLQKNFNPEKQHIASNTAIVDEVNLLPKYHIKRKKIPISFSRDSVYVYNDMEEIELEATIAWENIDYFSHIYAIPDSSHVTPNANRFYYKKYKIEFVTKGDSPLIKEGYIKVPVPPKKNKA